MAPDDLKPGRRSALPDPDAPTLTAGPSSEPAPATSRCAPGDRFGSYCLERLLGQGGFGEVWEARSEETGRRVALKILTHGDLSPEVKQRFEREAKVASSLHHPHCVFVFAAEEWEGTPALAMELVSGGSLQDELDRHGAMPWRRAVEVLLDLLSGLAAAHSHGILHRDIKPSNCFVAADGTVKVGDFGLSKPVEAGHDLTQTGTYLGTPAFSSPEQVRGRKLDVRSDIFSLGATFYSLLTGAQPFGRGAPGELMARILAEVPPSLASHGVDVPASVEKVLQRMMAKDPADRYRDYGELRRALLPFSPRALRPAALGVRFAAYLMDQILLALVGAWIPLALAVRPLSSEAALAAIALELFYFAGLETWLGGSLGKRLLDLRVKSASGEELSPLFGILRATVFVAVTSVLPALTLWLDRGVWRPEVLQLVGAFAVVATMRKSNGLAGSHELLTGSRVFFETRQRIATDPRMTETDRERQKTSELESFGPFQAHSEHSRSTTGALLRGFDPALQRAVWIYRYADSETAPALSVAAQNRRHWLPWLQGSRREGAAWDVYPVPAGEALLDRLARRRRLDWSEASRLLETLAMALESWPEDSDLQLSLNHLWVDSTGSLVILPFPVPSAWRGPAPELLPRRQWRALLRQAAIAMLEGEIRDESLAQSFSIRSPLPTRARSQLEPLLRGTAEGSPNQAAHSLAALRQRPTSVTASRRLLSLALSGAAPAFFFMIAIAPSSGGTPEIWELPKRLAQWRQLGTSVDALSADRRDAVEVLLVRGHVLLESGNRGPDVAVGRRIGRSVFGINVFRDQGASSVRTVLTAEDLELLSRLSAQRPTPAPDELRQARQRAGPLSGSRSPRGPSGFPILLGAIVSLPALLLTFLTRGGVSLGLAGIEVQKRHGGRAGRWRCLLRAALSYSPLFVGSIVPLAFLGARVAKASSGPAVALMVLESLVGLTLAVGGVAYALRHPERGAQDRLAGTWLVPR